jgi:DNA-binding SARP family transcriptional activator
VLEVRILGVLEVRDGEQIVSVRRRKQRALLAVLALHVGDPLSADRIVDELWGESPPKTARHALENYVSELRKVLGRDAIRTGPAGYVLDLEPDQVDATRFERLVADARGQTAHDRAEKLRDALSLVRGPPLGDLAFEPFAGPAVGRLYELELTAREELVDADLELGRHAEVVAELEPLVAEHRYRERPRAQLMLALYRSGRQAEALAVYQDGRRILVDDLGIDPGEELQELERAILRQDPTLRAPPRSPRPTAASPQPVSEARPSRKTVTLLHAELANAGVLAGALDPEALRLVLDRYRTAARAAVERHEGLSALIAGETALAVFGVPTSHEDDALRAVRAAHDLREAVGILNDGLLPEHGVFLEARIAVATGEVLVTPGESELVTGRPVAAAEELQRAAYAGQIVFDGQTHHLVRDSVGAEPLEDSETEAYRLVEVYADAHGRILRLDSPLVGRRRQLAALANAFESTMADRSAHLFTLVGDPGVGKSRLVREFLEAIAGLGDVLQGRCLPYGDAAAFSPLDAALRDAGIHGSELDDPSATQVQQLLASLAAERPLVVVLDDAHWADARLLDAVELVAESTRESAVLLIAIARPELLESRPGWGGGMPNASSVLLEPLTETETDRLVDNLLGESDLPDPIRDYIVRTADGNPLFVEELLATLVDRAILTREAGRWTTTQVEAIPLPPTIQALVAARLDRLPQDERAVVELASIDGTRTFGRDVVAALALNEDAVDVEGCLSALVRKELVRPQPGEEGRFEFRHQLIRDVAYESVPMRRRAELHDRVAEILEEAPPRAVDPGDRATLHRDVARRYRSELGSIDGAA